MVHTYRRFEATVLPTPSECEQPKNVRIPFFLDLVQRLSKSRISQLRWFTTQKNGNLNCAATNTSKLAAANQKHLPFLQVKSRKRTG